MKEEKKTKNWKGGGHLLLDNVAHAQVLVHFGMVKRELGHLELKQVHWNLIFFVFF